MLDNFTQFFAIRHHIIFLISTSCYPQIVYYTHVILTLLHLWLPLVGMWHLQTGLQLHLRQGLRALSFLHTELRNFAGSKRTLPLVDGSYQYKWFITKSKILSSWMSLYVKTTNWSGGLSRVFWFELYKQFATNLSWAR